MLLDPGEYINFYSSCENIPNCATHRRHQYSRAQVQWLWSVQELSQWAVCPRHVYKYCTLVLFFFPFFFIGALHVAHCIYNFIFFLTRRKKILVRAKKYMTNNWRPSLKQLKKRGRIMTGRSVSNDILKNLWVISTMTFVVQMSVSNVHKATMLMLVLRHDCVFFHFSFLFFAIRCCSKFELFYYYICLVFFCADK